MERSDVTLVAEDAPAAPRKEGAPAGKAQRRAMTYSFLAQALSSPREALCYAVDNGSLRPLLHEILGGAPGHYRRGVALSCLDKIAARTEGPFAAALLPEYTRLFGLNVLCPQYEADYVSGSSDNSVHTIASVANFYSTFGLRVADNAGERPDHIALELDFMSFLAAKEAYAHELGQAGKARSTRLTQKLFFGSHLSRWGAAFARNLGEATRLPFYVGTRELLADWVFEETKYLKIKAEVRPVTHNGAAELVNISNAVTARP